MLLIPKMKILISHIHRLAAITLFAATNAVAATAMPPNVFD
jgi:hypothetical protein